MLFASKIILQNMSELLGKRGRKKMLSLLCRCRFRKVWTKDKRYLSPAEIEYGHQEYEGTLFDTCEMVIHFCYVTLFVLAFPIVPFIALIAAIVEVRLDGFKMINFRRRPIPYWAPGLGVWVQVLEFISFVAIANNILFCVCLSEWPSMVLDHRTK